MAADATDQALSQNGFDGGRDHERRDPHVLQTRDRAGRVVGVQRAEDEVAGQRGLHGDFGRLQVANLTHQDPVGILPQDGPQAIRKRVADFRVDRESE